MTRSLPWRFASACFLMSLCFAAADALPISSLTPPPPLPPITIDVPLTIHLIPHSHCDPGWLLTADEYFSTQVHSIIDTVVAALEADPSRRFIWSEVSYFTMWWRSADDAWRARLKSLVDSGALEMVMGGWVMNDEALPSLDAIVDQYTLGHSSLAATVGARPVYGWQIDPFGASALTPELLAQMGYKALVHHRINQRLTGRFLNVDELKDWSGSMLMAQGMQFDWKYAQSSPPLLTHVMVVAHPPPPPSLILPPPLTDASATGWLLFTSRLRLRGRSRSRPDP